MHDKAINGESISTSDEGNPVKKEKENKYQGILEMMERMMDTVLARFK